jgi:hypothetical protein
VQRSGHPATLSLSTLSKFEAPMEWWIVVRFIGVFFKVFKKFQFLHIPKSKNRWSQLFKKNLSELSVLMEEPIF